MRFHPLPGGQGGLKAFGQWRAAYAAQHVSLWSLRGAYEGTWCATGEPRHWWQLGDREVGVLRWKLRGNKKGWGSCVNFFEIRRNWKYIWYMYIIYIHNKWFIEFRTELTRFYWVVDHVSSLMIYTWCGCHGNSRVLPSRPPPIGGEASFSLNNSLL